MLCNCLLNEWRKCWETNSRNFVSVTHFLWIFQDIKTVNELDTPPPTLRWYDRIYNRLIHLKMLLGNNSALTSGAGKQTTCDVQLLLQGADRADLRMENIIRWSLAKMQVNISSHPKEYRRIIHHHSCWGLELSSHPNGSVFYRSLLSRVALISQRVL